MSLLRKTTATIEDFAGREPFATVFGELVVGTRENNVNVSFSKINGHIGDTEYLKSTRVIQSGTGGDVNENETAYVFTGAGIANSELISINTNRYIPGHGNETFKTMVFDGAEAGVNSGVGYGTKDGDFLGFGFEGLDFGIWVTLRGVRNFVKQANWNVDTLLTGDFIIDPSKENISGDAFGWLGVADILYYVNVSEDHWVLVHRHETANIDNKPHMEDPTQPMSAWIERPAGAGANIRVGTSSWYAGTVGNRAAGTGSDKTPLIERDGVSVNTTESVLLSIRNKTTFAGKTNTIRVRYGTLTITSEGNRAVVFKVYLNGVRYDTGLDTWADFDTDLSVTEINTDAPLQLTTTAILPTVNKTDQQVGSTALQKTDRDRINLFDSDVIIAAFPGDIITITGKTAAGTSEVDIQLRWIEEF